MKKAQLKAIIEKNLVKLSTELEIRDAEGAQLIDGEWYGFLWGCDTLQNILDEIENDTDS